MTLGYNENIDLLHIYSVLKWALLGTSEILGEQMAYLTTHLQVGCTNNSTHDLTRTFILVPVPGVNGKITNYI
jgi:hypothetical protein